MYVAKLDFSFGESVHMQLIHNLYKQIDFLHIVHTSNPKDPSSNSNIHSIMKHIVNFVSFLLALSAACNFSHAQAVDIINTAANTPGGKRYASEIGDAEANNALGRAGDLIYNIFLQHKVADMKPVGKITLFIDDIEGVAYTRNSEIHFSARYINNFKGDLTKEFYGVIFHEMTHILQWTGNGKAPQEVLDGIADYVVLRDANAPSDWVKPGEGDRWDQGNDVTAQFLHYCRDLRSDFVGQLNKKMRYGYSPHFFVDLLGKSAHQLWRDYKAKYGK